MACDLRIVREGGSWVVVEKPAGLLSVPGKGDAPEKKDCVAARVASMFPHAEGPLIVHRLDMDTSGLLVLGLTARAQRLLSKQFEERTVEKRYVALLEGIVEHASPDWQEASLPIRLDPANRPWQIVDGLYGRPSLTMWRLRSFETDRTRVEFRPVTGRAHQLRVHAAVAQDAGGIGHCVQGDVLYGSGYQGPHARGRPADAPRLMLHAAALEFNDPETGERIRCECPAGF